PTAGSAPGPPDRPRRAPAPRRPAPPPPDRRADRRARTPLRDRGPVPRPARRGRGSAPRWRRAAIALPRSDSGKAPGALAWPPPPVAPAPAKWAARRRRSARPRGGIGSRCPSVPAGIALAGADRDWEDVLARRNGAVVERREGAGRV